MARVRTSLAKNSAQVAFRLVGWAEAKVIRIIVEGARRFDIDALTGTTS